MFGFVEREKACHRVAIMCHILGVSTSGYYRWSRSGPCLRSRRDLELTQRIRQVHVASRGTYGSPRVHAELTLGQGIDCGRKRVARLMRAAGLVGIHRRLYHGITRRPVFPDHVGRDFMPKAPNRLWVADLTQHPTGEGWLYAGVVLDAFSRRVVGWAMGDRPVSALPVNALRMATGKRSPVADTVHHSDHGAQYTSLAFGETLIAAGLKGSMGRVGDAYDNAVAESFFATLQTELLDRRSWPTRQLLRSAIFDYIECFYNRQRRHSTLGYLSPEDYERRWLIQHQCLILSTTTKPKNAH